MKRKRYYQAYTSFSPAQRRVQAMRSSRPRWRGKLAIGLSVLVVVAAAVVVGARQHGNAHASVTLTTTPAAHSKTTAPVAQTQTPAPSANPTPSPTPAVAPAPPKPTPKPAPTACDGNTLAQNVIISIAKRHMWACETGKQVYDSAVVTGMENLAADLTPTGTFHIYGKQTNLYLKGSDSTGSWNDFVNYWMPFLSNQYGVYGFHDATWRNDSDFGNIDPYSTDASHGCVELPLATAKWLYGWASIGTTVTIES